MNRLMQSSLYILRLTRTGITKRAIGASIISYYLAVCLAVTPLFAITFKSAIFYTPTIGSSAMLSSWSLLTIPVVLLLATSVQADFKPYISTSADIRTECKTCPRSLCPNQLFYDFDETLNVTCWTLGTKIMGDRLWLKSQAGCYITQYDVTEYSGDCKTCLSSLHAFADV